MKFSLLLILPCFLTISTVSSGSFAAFEGATLSDSENSIVASHRAPSNDTAHRGSGRRDVLAHSLLVDGIA